MSLLGTMHFIFMSLLVFFSLFLMSGKSSFSFIFMSLFHRSFLPLHFFNFILMIWLKFTNLLNNFTSSNDFFFIKFFQFGLVSFIAHLLLKSRLSLHAVNLGEVSLLRDGSIPAVIVFSWFFILDFGLDFLVMLLIQLFNFGVMIILNLSHLYFELLDLSL